MLIAFSTLTNKHWEKVKGFTYIWVINPLQKFSCRDLNPDAPLLTESFAVKLQYLFPSIFTFRPSQRKRQGRFFFLETKPLD